MSGGLSLVRARTREVEPALPRGRVEACGTRAAGAAGRAYTFSRAHARARCGRSTSEDVMIISFVPISVTDTIRVAPMNGWKAMGPGRGRHYESRLRSLGSGRIGLGLSSADRCAWASPPAPARRGRERERERLYVWGPSRAWRYGVRRPHPRRRLPPRTRLAKGREGKPLRRLPLLCSLEAEPRLAHPPP